MSEEILKALMQLFAIIAKQDEGAAMEESVFVQNFLNQQLSEDFVNEYLKLFESFAGINSESGETSNNSEEKKRKLTSVKDSVRTLGICKKINKTLTQKQKVVVLVRLYELVAANRQFTPQRMSIIDTVADVFNIEKEEKNIINDFITSESHEAIDSSDIMVISDADKIACEHCKHINSEQLNGNILILRTKSVNLYFLRYTGNGEVFLNGLSVSSKYIYLFANGSTIKVPGGKPIFYSDIVANFLADLTPLKLSFNVNHLEYVFPNGARGLKDVSISEEQGRLVGIMGASGAGKTTLLNVLSGIEHPSSGEVKINGINLHTEKDKLEGVIGYIPQDDLLIEELTVYENLYYNAKLCFRDKEEDVINKLVLETLSNLGLTETSHLKVGNPLDKKISGGQRKRLNIALELIREPSVLFVDEPTSGLSSQDSENVMDLLRELTFKGKLIFVVIHQPSSVIYKMFDKIIFMDTGGYLTWYGNPVEAIMYFKRIDNQINSEIGECPVCGNVNPETIFNIVEAKVVDEFGRTTDKRKRLPKLWSELYHKNFSFNPHEDINELPQKTLSIPSRLKQSIIFFKRDLFSKLSNRQYLLINLLEAPALAFVLSFIVRYIDNPSSDVYIFRENENIPAYIFMCTIVMLFIGLTVSAEEIFRDRKILKREAFLNLSRSSYLLSKIAILFIISAIQTFMFVMTGNSILEIQGMYFDYWLFLFSVSCLSNMMGLNISTTFNSAVTIYIVIPLLIIPQMVLGGGMFTFDKLNRVIGGGYNVPFVAELMPARWAYEGLTVNQYMNNKFGKIFYATEKKESINDYKQAYYIPELIDIANKCKNSADIKDDSIKKVLDEQLKLLHFELSKETASDKTIGFAYLNRLNSEDFYKGIADYTIEYLEKAGVMYSLKFNTVFVKKELLIMDLQQKESGKNLYRELRDNYYNEYLADVVRKKLNKNKLVVSEGKFIQIADPIYKDPEPKGLFGLKTHFFSPAKYAFGKYISTFTYNLIVTWVLALILYFTLYFEVFRKIISSSKSN